MKDEVACPETHYHNQVMLLVLRFGLEYVKGWGLLRPEPVSGEPDLRNWIYLAIDSPEERKRFTGQRTMKELGPWTDVTSEKFREGQIKSSTNRTVGFGSVMESRRKRNARRI
ncbi:hypothetical protein ElyMa_002041800 [Elysia marginata]|uniref:Uncharacterized protein n=1 Tax=Elysia marginata TaxID=1093978 RepID=A0AAV4F811_9GAST|nr:hypothetical protein ElyMa_002041800 [Elysia marginata]